MTNSLRTSLFLLALLALPCLAVAAGEEAPLKVVVFGGHPDDPESGCGGLIATLVAAGHDVHVGYATCFRGDRKINGQPEGDVRRHEAAEACRVLGAHPRFFPYAHQKLVADETTLKDVSEWLNAVKPDAVVTHWPLDMHPNHHVASSLIWQCYQRQGGWHLYFFEVMSGSQTMAFHPDRYLDLAPVLDKKKACLEAHTSQNPAGIWAVHEKMHLARGGECGVDRAEGYLLLEAKSGVRLLPIDWRMAHAKSGDPSLKLSWKDNHLTIHGDSLPGGDLDVHYLEAYCRPGSTDRDWGQTVIRHRTELVSTDADGRRIELLCTLTDGVQVKHLITAGTDEVDFQLVAINPTEKASEADWAQPCIRLDAFTGCGQESYVPKCFVFLDGELTRLPTRPWATKARYVPGQVYCPKHVDRNDVNPRPLSELLPSNGLCGAFSADEKWIMATAWEPYQELFQGVRICMHSDFRIGGLKPGETKKIRGKIYLVPADVAALVSRYERDFPEHRDR